MKADRVPDGWELVPAGVSIAPHTPTAEDRTMGRGGVGGVSISPNGIPFWSQGSNIWPTYAQPTERKAPTP